MRVIDGWRWVVVGLPSVRECVCTVWTLCQYMKLRQLFSMPVLFNICVIVQVMWANTVRQWPGTASIHLLYTFSFNNIVWSSTRWNLTKFSRSFHCPEQMWPFRQYWNPRWLLWPDSLKRLPLCSIGQNFVLSELIYDPKWLLIGQDNCLDYNLDHNHYALLGNWPPLGYGITSLSIEKQ